MFIIVGLGNPGRDYENTRHNAGYIALDYIADKFDININQTKHKSLCGTGYIEGQKVLLLKPLTYMNLSGEAVIDAINFYKADSTTELLVLYDDISLDVGKLRLRKKGSAGGHNGIKSIIKCTGSENFHRIKIGVGNKPSGYDLADYVLSHFPKNDLEALNANKDAICDATKLMVLDQFDKAMNLYN